MLVLTRKSDESIVIGDSIEIVVLEVRNNRVKLGFRGPTDVTIRRSELMGRSTPVVRSNAVMAEVCRH